MSLLNPHEALIYLMVITSAVDRDMTDVELARIGNVLKTWPVFQDFDDWKLIRVAQDCQQRLQEENGLASILAASTGQPTLQGPGSPRANPKRG